MDLIYAKVDSILLSRLLAFGETCYYGDQKF